MEKNSPTDFRDSEGFDVIGARCQLDTCSELDFLPFTCEFCGKQFCLAHAEPNQHSCPELSKSQGVLAVVCEVCKHTIRWVDGEQTKEDAIASHKTDCKAPPTATAKERCPVKGCKELLGLINSTVCNRCKLKVCLAHRFEDAHQCGESRSQWLSKMSASTSTKSTGEGCLQRLGGDGSLGGTPAEQIGSTGGTSLSSAGAAAAARATSLQQSTTSSKSSSSLALLQKVTMLRKALGGTPDQQSCCLQTLHRLLTNVVGDPSNPKFRTLKKENKTIQTKIVNVPGGVALLQALGFEDTGETYELPTGKPGSFGSELLRVLS